MTSKATVTNRPELSAWSWLSMSTSTSSEREFCASEVANRDTTALKLRPGSSGTVTCAGSPSWMPTNWLCGT